MLNVYYPEMQQPRPAADIDAALGHYGKHYFLKTHLTLKGRGIEYLDEVNGRHRYKVTERAFELICQKHSVASEALL